MKILRKMMVALLVIALMVMLLPASVFAADKTVVIFHTNDIHGRAEGSDSVVGYARYKEIIEAEKLVADEVIVLDAGDAVHGTLFAQFSLGESIIDLMNAVGVDAMACGNHEFDYGADQLQVLEGKASFPIMGANVKKGAANFFGTNHKTFEVDGKKIVVFGIATPETKVKAHPNYTAGVSFGAGSSEEDLAAFAVTVQAVIDSLKDDADFLIMVGHLGVDMSSTIRTTTLLPLLTDLDLVIDGHSHTEYDHLIKDKSGKEVQVAQTGFYFANVGKITLTVGDEVGIDSVALLAAADLASIEGDAAILALIQQFKDDNEAELTKPIGKTATLLEQFGDFRGSDVALVRDRETNLGDLVADALRNATGADVAMTNGGGIRANIDPGVITFGDANTVLPFGNLITVIRVSGQQILDALAHGAGGYPSPGGGFPQVSGMSYVIVTEGKGENEKFLKISDVLVDGKPIDPKKSYTLATNDFMAVGGDGYTMFEGSEQVLLHGLMLEAFIDEIKALTTAAGGMEGPGFTYKVDGRIAAMSLGELEPTVPTGETMTYVLTGVFFLATAGLFLALGKRKVEES